MRAINLLPPDQRGGDRSATRTALSPWHGIVGAGALVLLVLLGMWAMARSDASSARQAEAAALARSAAAQAQVDRLRPVVALDARRKAREGAVEHLADGRTDWATVLRSVAGALPRQVGVQTLTLKAAGATAAGGAATPAGLGGSGSATIGACADTQPRVATALRALRRLPQVADVALNQTSRSDAQGAAGAADCRGVTVDAAVGLSPAAVLDAPEAPRTRSAAARDATDAPEPTSGAAR